MSRILTVLLTAAAVCVRGDSPNSDAGGEDIHSFGPMLVRSTWNEGDFFGEKFGR